jgi:hypothetical protein
VPDAVLIATLFILPHVQPLSLIPASLHPLPSPQREIWFDQMLHHDVSLSTIGG